MGDQTVQRDETDVCRWHFWFAWRPVSTLEAKRVWLERVWRRAIRAGYTSWYEYSTLGPERVPDEWDWLVGRAGQSDDHPW